MSYHTPNKVLIKLTEEEKAKLVSDALIELADNIHSHCPRYLSIALQNASINPKTLSGPTWDQLLTAIELAVQKALEDTVISIEEQAISFKKDLTL